MLKSLHIQNYLIIEEAVIQFENGFTAITGETGAGKSLLLGAFGLIMGDRISSQVMKDQNQKCVVEATFDIDKVIPSSFFEENDIDYDSQTIVRREITPSGKSRAFVNDTPVGVKTLKDLGEYLVDVHGQSENQLLLQAKHQLAFLDIMAGNDELLSTYNENFKKHHSILQELEALEEQQKKFFQEKAFKEFQLKEIEEAQIEDSSELASLEEELVQFENIGTIQEALNQLSSSLQMENGPLDILHSNKSSIGKISQLNDAYNQLAERIESTHIELKDLADEAEGLFNQLNWDEEQYTVTKERVDLLNTLLQKHHIVELSQLIVIKEELESALQEQSDSDAKIEELKRTVLSLQEKLASGAAELRKKRLGVIPQVKEELESLLANMSMPSATVEIELGEHSSFKLNGKDDIQWMLQLNKGTPAGLMKTVASGGELSRIMLSMKYMMAQHRKLPCLILDEVDTGVSGEVALQIAQLVAQFGENAQVMAITHLPQVAGKALHHLKVKKVEEGNKTMTQLEWLNPEHRVNEIAEMIGGKSFGKEAQASAVSLLG